MTHSDRVLKRAVSVAKQMVGDLLVNRQYDESRLDYDVRLLRQFYLARGYADINVSRVRGGLLPDRTGFAVTFILEERTSATVLLISISQRDREY